MSCKCQECGSQHKPEKDSLEELRTEYAEQDNRATAYPIFVTVQELVSIGVMADGYSVNCPYGDGKNLSEYRCQEYEGTWKDKDDLIDRLKEDSPDKDEIDFDIEEITVGYIWRDVEFFLTVKGAEEYMMQNKHNHGRTRTFVQHFNRRNYEMRDLLDKIGFKTSD